MFETELGASVVDNNCFCVLAGRAKTPQSAM